MFTINHLEPVAPRKDPFTQPHPNLPGPIYVKGDTKSSKSYKIEKLIDKHVTPTGRVKYLL